MQLGKGSVLWNYIKVFEKALVKSLLFVLVSLEIGDGKERRASPSSRSEA